MSFVAFLLINVLRILKYALLLRVLLSWINPDPTSRLNQILYQITEPMLAPIRNLLPRAGMIDFSPILAFVALDLMQMGVLRILS